MTKCQANLNTDRNCLHCLLNFMANFQLLGYNLSEKAYFKVGNIEEGSLFGVWPNIWELAVHFCDLFKSYKLAFRKVFCSNLSKVLIVSS